MAAREAAFSVFCSVSSTSPKSFSCLRPSSSIKRGISISAPTLSLRLRLCPLPLLPLNTTPKLSFQIGSAVQEIEVEEKTDKIQQTNERRKLFVLNLPWSFTVADIKNLFGQSGTVTDVEIIKHKDGKNRGFAFVTMASGDEAQAVIDKFDSHEVVGRIIRVEFAKRLKKPSAPPPASPPPRETRHKLYISNLAWKVRSSDLREFFAASFNPVSARVVFDSPSGRSAGYGFVSFETKGEAEAVISALDGKELMGRPLRLKFSEKNTDESEKGKDEENISEGEPEQP